MPIYVVVLGAESDARFREDDGPMEVLEVPTPVGPVTVTFRTRHGREGFEAPVPREMWIEVRGEAEESDLRSVVEPFANAAAGFLPLIAVSANAYVGDVEPKLAFDATPGVSERAFFQSLVREEFGMMPTPGRRVNLDATSAFFVAAISHPDSERLRRAANQYALGLNQWMWGSETLALAHLFIGMEVLTPLALRRECDRESASEKDLIARWNIDDRCAHVRKTRLLAEVRRRILFQGDDQTHQSAKKASDGFEHGFLDFVNLRTLARQARDSTATYLRHAIFDLCDLDGDTRATLQAHPYDLPIRSFVARYLWGNLLGEADDLAAPDQEYPIFQWKSKMEAFRRNADGTYTVTPEETMRANFNKALKFKPEGFEVWGPAGVTTPPIPTGGGDEETEERNEVAE